MAAAADFTGYPSDPRGTRLIIAGMTGLVVSVTGLVTIALRRRRW